MPRITCPHLGCAGAGDVPRNRPSDRHRCFVEAAGETIPHRQQAQRCLSSAWPECFKLQPGYVPLGAIAAPRDTAPPEATAPRPALSLASRRLLERATSAPPAPVPAVETPAPLPSWLDPAPPTSPTPWERPRPTIAAEAATLPAVPLDWATIAPAAPTPAPRGGSWQTPLLWLVLALPTTLLLAVVGLAGLALLSQRQAPMAQAMAATERGGRDLSVAEIIAPTPAQAAPTFVPLAAPPDASYSAPALPAAPPPQVDSTIRPGPWPSERASGAPDRIRVPRLGIDAAVIPVDAFVQEVSGQPVIFHQVARFAAGWHTDSSLPGFKGNVVMAGHHNTAGRVFEELWEVEPGDFIFVEINGVNFPYLVVITEIVEESSASDEQRAINGQWIAQTEDERLTLVTCWPPDGNSHRVIVVAIPAK